MWDHLIAILIHADLKAAECPTRSPARPMGSFAFDVIEDNQVFWSRVAAETDNDREWIPNKSQTSALPITFPPETGDLWRQVLADADAMLRGEQLIPHWRLRGDAGIDLAALMQNPPEIDIIGLFQGETILPYAQVGRRIDGQSLRQFEDLLGGDALLFAVILN